MTTLAVLACLLAAVAPSGDYDPTNPEDVGRQATPPPAEAPLAGPDADASQADSMRGGMRDGLGGMMAPSGPMGILMSRCGSCHGPEKQKGGVRVTPIDALFAGDRQDWVVVPGNPDQSVLMQRITLPEGHDDIMPPKGGPLSRTEVESIRSWIASARTPEALISNARSQATKGGGKSDPRDWLTAYLSIDLTPDQRSAGIALAQELRQKRQKRGGGRRGSDGPPSGAGSDADPKARRQALEAMAKQLADRQEALWVALSREQQEAMRTLMADPEALAKARATLRSRMRRGGGRPEQGGKPQ